ncbi:MAG TPA: SCO family protein [Thermoanaerobaculia bacterium]|nr:SCO family protein [Thermoanaerobaculia bacterium]
MSARRLAPFWALAAILVLLPAFGAAGEDVARRREAGRAYFTDVVLIDQQGHEQRLWSDLVENRVVLISPFFTHCEGVCPKLSATLGRLQDRLGDRLGKDVLMLSITVDPARDTPAKVREYAAQLKARPGWLFLSGKKENVDLALTKLGYYVDQPEGHSNLVIVGNERTGLWKKAFGLASAEELEAVLQSVLRDAG